MRLTTNAQSLTLFMCNRKVKTLPASERRKPTLRASETVAHRGGYFSESATVKMREEKFWDKVNKQGPVPSFNPALGRCWMWTASFNGSGYGKSFFLGRQKSLLAHRLAFSLVKGEIPDGLTLDHLCRNPACVNPDHLEAVSLRTNILRGVGACAINAKKTHCIRGHLLNGDNLINMKTGYRRCRICSNLRQSKAYLEAKALAELDKLNKKDT